MEMGLNERGCLRKTIEKEIATRHTQILTFNTELTGFFTTKLTHG